MMVVVVIVVADSKRKIEIRIKNKYKVEDGGAGESALIEFFCRGIKCFLFKVILDKCKLFHHLFIRNEARIWKFPLRV